MPIFDNLSVTSLIWHAQDFAFEKNKGEIANGLRDALTANPEFDYISLDIDRDGDITIKRRKATCYVSPNAVWAFSRVSSPANLHDVGNDLQTTLETVFGLRRKFQTEMFEIRCYFRFYGKGGLELLRSRVGDVALAAIHSDNTPSNVSQLRFRARYQRNEFLDSLDAEANSDDTQIRYTRTASAGTFHSYGAFANKADLSAMIEGLRPFIGIVQAQQSTLADLA